MLVTLRQTGAFRLRRNYELVYGHDSRVARIPLRRPPWPWSVCCPRQSACVRRQGKEYDKKNYRNYWAYSIACFFVWGVILAVRAAVFGNSSTTHDVLFVFAGWCIAWVSTTIARSVYPPTKRRFEPSATTE